MSKQNILPNIRFSGGGFSRQHRQSAVFPAGGLLFFCVRRKEAKEDRIGVVSARKKRPPQSGSPMSKQNILPKYTLFGRVREGAFPGEKPSPANTANPPFFLPGAFFSSVSEEKKQKKTALALYQPEKRDRRKAAAPCPNKTFFPNIRFSGGCGRGLFPGKSLLPLTLPIRRFSCRGPSFLLCQKKRSKRRPHWRCISPKKETAAKRQPHVQTKHSSQIYAFREGAGGGFSRGKAFSRQHRQHPQNPIICLPPRRPPPCR